MPPVRCKIAPSKDAVRWRSTPATQEDESDQGVESRNSESQVLSSKDNSSGVDPSALASATPELQTPNSELQLVRPGLGDVGTPNAERQTPNAERQGSTDAWFQIPTETPDLTDIQEAVLTPSADDSNKAGPEPLAQVLADLARRAQRNFVDPGIPSTETITYNFADSEVDPWEAFTRIAQTRGYGIVYRGDIVTLARNQEDPLNPVNPRTVKAEVWLDQIAKPRPDQFRLAIQLADSNVFAPKSKPRTVRSLELGTSAKISLIDLQSEGGDSALGLTITPTLLPNGNIQADFGIENAVPSSDGRKSSAIRRTTRFTVELTPAKQVIEIEGILMPKVDPNKGKQAWFQRLFRKKAQENGTARMVVKFAVEPVAGSETPIPIENPPRPLKSDSGKTSIVLVPRQNGRTPELTSTQTLKH